MKIDQFDSGRREDDNRPWRKHAAPLNKAPADPKYPTQPFNHDEWMKTSKPMEEGSDLPVPGDAIRTPKLEGKVTKVEDGYVYFTTADGRNMRNTIENVTVVEKLADQDDEMFEDEEIDEVSTELLTKYKTAAAKDARAADKSGDYGRGNKRFSGIVKATKKQFDNDAKKKTEEGTMGGINRSAPAVDVSYEKVLDEVKARWEESQLNELSVGKMQAYKDAAKSNDSFKQRPLRKLAKSVQGVAVANQKINTRTGARKDDPDAGKGTNEDAITNILTKQHDEKKAAARKPPVNIEYHGWIIRYRPASQPGERVVWQVMKPGKKGQEDTIMQKGEAMDDKSAMSQAEEWIKQGGGTSKESSSNVTIDFNVNFAKEFGHEFYANILADNDGPKLMISTEPMKSLKRSHPRNQKDKITATTTKLPCITMSPGEANEAGLRPNGRYVLGPKEDMGEMIGFPLIFQSVVQAKGDMVKLNKPGLTVAHNREVDEEYRGPWQGDSEKYTKAPKSSTQGKGEVRLSDMVQDSIKEHGVKWAFDYYVHKHGMPPRQFQIFAGLTANKPAKAVDPMPSPQQSQPVAKAPEKQSWWKKLRGKLPFEE